MESLMSFFEILRPTFKIFSKNGKIFAFVALITLFTKSVLYFLNFYTIKPILSDLFMEEILLNTTNPSSPEYANIISHIKKDAKMFVGFEIFYSTISTVAFLLLTTATVLAAAIIYGDKGEELSLKDLAKRTAKSWLRPLVTWLYVFLFTFVFLFVLAIIFTFITALTMKSPSTLFLATIGVLAIVLYMYLSVNWILAIVISAVEKSKGIEALEKAAKIIKGMKLQGFLLNLLVNIVILVISLGLRLIAVAKSPSIAIIKGLIIVYCSSLADMYYYAAFTVIYYMCKKNHGERVELEESSTHGYSKIPATATAPVVDHDLP